MLNENIRRLRKARGLSQEVLAAQLHIVRQTLSKWEQGLSVPDAQMLSRLAEALQTTVADLLGEAPPVPEGPDAIRALAEKLAVLNNHYAREQARRRRFWRIVCIIVLTLSALTVATYALVMLTTWLSSRELSASVGVIGGADGPTRIFVAHANSQWLTLALAIAAGAAAIVGLVRLKKGDHP